MFVVAVFGSFEHGCGIGSLQRAPHHDTASGNYFRKNIGSRGCRAPKASPVVWVARWGPSARGNPFVFENKAWLVGGAGRYRTTLLSSSDIGQSFGPNRIRSVSEFASIGSRPQQSKEVRARFWCAASIFQGRGTMAAIFPLWGRIQVAEAGGRGSNIFRVLRRTRQSGQGLASCRAQGASTVRHMGLVLRNWVSATYAATAYNVYVASLACYIYVAKIFRAFPIRPHPCSCATEGGCESASLTSFYNLLARSFPCLVHHRLGGPLRRHTLFFRALFQHRGLDNYRIVISEGTPWWALLLWLWRLCVRSLVTPATSYTLAPVRLTRPPELF